MGAAPSMSLAWPLAPSVAFRLPPLESKLRRPRPASREARLLPPSGKRLTGYSLAVRSLFSSLRVLPQHSYSWQVQAGCSRSFFMATSEQLAFLLVVWRQLAQSHTSPCASAPKESSMSQLWSQSPWPCGSIPCRSMSSRMRPNPSVKGTSRKRAAPYVER